jgi:DNA-directed RNA polymerase subunit RPC12/RpoP
MAICSRCKAEFKPLRGYRSTWCNECTSNPAAYNKRANLRRYYGIEWEEYQALLAAQNHRCYICGTKGGKGAGGLGVDHNHETGQVRKILCAKCNTGLGAFKDQIELLEAAIAYLREHEEITR